MLPQPQNCVTYHINPRYQAVQPSSRSHRSVQQTTRPLGVPSCSSKMVPGPEKRGRNESPSGCRSVRRPPHQYLGPKHSYIYRRLSNQIPPPPAVLSSSPTLTFPNHGASLQIPAFSRPNSTAFGRLLKWSMQSTHLLQISIYSRTPAQPSKQSPLLTNPLTAAPQK